jgi:hypothetical protein
MRVLQVHTAPSRASRQRSSSDFSHTMQDCDRVVKDRGTLSEISSPVHGAAEDLHCLATSWCVLYRRCQNMLLSQESKTGQSWSISSSFYLIRNRGFCELWREQYATREFSEGNVDCEPMARPRLSSHILAAAFRFYTSRLSARIADCNGDGLLSTRKVRDEHLVCLDREPLKMPNHTVVLKRRRSARHVQIRNAPLQEMLALQDA